MMAKFQTIALSAASIALVASLSACGGGGETPAPSGDAGGGDAAVETPAEAPEAGGGEEAGGAAEGGGEEAAGGEEAGGGEAAAE